MGEKNFLPLRMCYNNSYLWMKGVQDAFNSKK